MGPYLRRVRRNCPPLVGEPLSSSYWGGGPLWSSNQSAILANGTGVSTPWGEVSTRENSIFFSRLSNFRIYGMTPGPGMGTNRPRVELALQYTNPSQLEIGRSVALGISTLCGEVSIASVAYQVILEAGIGQFRESKSPRVHTRINSWGLFLAHKSTCGKRESVS